jgi:hypothetical protein
MPLPRATVNRMTVSVDNLEAVGNVVDRNYQHLSKVFTPEAPLLLPDAYLKWYVLRREDQEVSATADAEARQFLRDEASTRRLPISGDLGFVVHHLSGEHVHLLLVCTWRADNEMWETSYYKDFREDGPFRPMPQGTHRGVICVWEFGPVAHEHRAWTRYLQSARDQAAKRAYVESQASGTI